MDSIEMMDKDLIPDEALEKVSGGAGMTPPCPVSGVITGWIRI